MTDALTVQLAKAVLSDLETAAYAQPIGARRGYDPEIGLEELQALEKTDVLVIASGIDTDIEDRQDLDDTLRIDLGVRKKLATGDLAELDGLVALVEEIQRDHLGSSPAAYRDAVCTEAKITPLYSQKHLHDHRVFFSVIQLTYEGVS